LDKPEVSPQIDNLVQVNRNAALLVMSRIFRRNVTKQVEKWHSNVIPEKRLELINNQLSENLEENYEYLAKIGALESASKLYSQITYRAKAKAFKLIA